MFDDSERGLDAPTGIQDTVLRLAKDGRHVLIFRGAIIRAGEEVTRDLQQSKAILLVRESE